MASEMMKNVPQCRCRVMTLTYHHVGTPPAGVRYRGLYTSKAILGWHIRFLRMLGFEFATVSEAFACGLTGVCKGQGRVRKIACFTFDDGHVDNISLALPVLKAMGVRATLFVVTGDVGKQGIVWAEAGDRHPNNLVDWDGVRTLHEAGWEIGSHAREHIHLDRHPAHLQAESLVASSADILRECGTAPQSIAYPYGCYSVETLTAAREGNFKLGFGTKAGLSRADEPGLELRRLEMRGYRVLHALWPVVSYLRNK